MRTQDGEARRAEHTAEHREAAYGRLRASAKPYVRRAAVFRRTVLQKDLLTARMASVRMITLSVEILSAQRFAEKLVPLWSSQFSITFCLEIRSNGTPH
eukprot:6201591-Pleurochrysis_carterae.AAC.2